MADSDGVNDAGATDGEKDLVADFLMREQDKLAGLEDDFGMNIRLRKRCQLGDRDTLCMTAGNWTLRLRHGHFAYTTFRRQSN